MKMIEMMKDRRMTPTFSEKFTLNNIMNSINVT